MQYELKPVTFYLSSGIGNKWWKQEAQDAYQIVSDAIPEWIGLVIHRGLTPEKTVGNHWAVSDNETGGILTANGLLPVYDKDALIKLTIASVQKWTREAYQQNIKCFRHNLKNLKYVGKKRLSSADKNSRTFLSLN